MPKPHATYTLNCQMYLKKLLKRQASKATVIDQIPAKFLRDGGEVLAAPSFQRRKV